MPPSGHESDTHNPSRYPGCNRQVITLSPITVTICAHYLGSLFATSYVIDDEMWIMVGLYYLKSTLFRNGTWMVFVTWSVNSRLGVILFSNGNRVRKQGGREATRTGTQSGLSEYLHSIGLPLTHRTLSLSCCDLRKIQILGNLVTCFFTC